MTKRTKALNISKKVKALVWERDGHRCINCGSPEAMPNAHYIPRSRSGLGIEENTLTLCWPCHRRYDQTTEREALKEKFKDYLMSIYPGWDEANLVYKKG